MVRGKALDDESMDDLVKWQLEGTGFTMEDFDAKGFVAYGKDKIFWDRLDGLKLKTPSKKIEFKSSLLEDAGFQQEAVTMMLTLVPGVMALTLLLAAVGGLLLGMGWHASLSSPGALGKAFRNLRLGKALAAAGLAILLGGLTTNHPLLANLLLVAMSVFVLQGLALIHAAAAARKTGCDRRSSGSKRRSMGSIVLESPLGATGK